MSIRLKVVAAIFASILMIPSVYAANGEWTTVASACVTDERSEGLYSLEQARFEFLAGQTGQIISRCNITDPHDLFNAASPPWNTMDVTYDDPNGFNGLAASSRVRVQLRRVHEVTGASATLETFDSNLFPGGQQLRSHPFSHDFDFYNYAYYLTIMVDRDNIQMVPRIQRVRLWWAPVG